MIELILIICFTALLLFYIYFILSIYFGLSKHPLDVKPKVLNELVSLLIPFRNESENILKSLESVENQTYPKDKFEVFYINDSSTDDSLSKLMRAKKSSNVNVISLPDNFLPSAHKKRAVRFGIENCNGEIIVTTDADCIHQKDWLETMLGYYDENTGFISGPVEFEKGETLFDKVQRIEFAGLILAGAGLIGINKPTICNAANASYRKSTYRSVNGFDDNLHLSSGDDEILMQKIRRKGEDKIKFCMNRKAVVSSLSNKTFSQFYHQRKRWASKGLFYINKFLILKLVLLFLFYFGLIAQLIIGFIYSPSFLIMFLISFLTKMILEYAVLRKGIRLLFDKDLLKAFLITELLHIPYIVIFSILGAFGKFKWKDRAIKR